MTDVVVLEANLGHADRADLLNVALRSSVPRTHGRWVILACEAHQWWGQLDVAGGTVHQAEFTPPPAPQNWHNRSRGKAEVAVITGPDVRVTRKPEWVKVMDGPARPSKFQHDRWLLLVWATVDGEPFLFVSGHFQANVVRRGVVHRKGPDAVDFRDGVHETAGLVAAAIADDVSVVFGADLNHRRRVVAVPPLPLWDGNPWKVLQAAGMPLRGHGIDAIGTSAATVTWDGDVETITPARGCDHDWLRGRIRTHRKAPPMTITQDFERALRGRGCAVLNHDQWRSDPSGRDWPLAPDVDDVYAYRREHKPHRLLPGRPVDTLWQHVSVTEATGDPAADMRVIERIGFDRFGSGVSYNVAVHPSGAILLGQPLDAKGTHTVNQKGIPGFSYDQNYVSLAVVWIGVPGDVPTPAAEEAIADVMAALIEIDALTPGFDYVPHSLVAPKECPMQVMRDRMKAIRAAGTDQPPKPNKVQRAQVQAEELRKTLRRAEQEAASIASLLEDVPETRQAVVAWRTQLQQTVADLKGIRIDVRDDADQAPDK